VGRGRLGAFWDWVILDGNRDFNYFSRKIFSVFFCLDLSIYFRQRLVLAMLSLEGAEMQFCLYHNKK
jgi:hypothetical protein